MFEIVNPNVENSHLFIKLSNLDENICEDDIYTFFKGINITGVYLSRDWLNEGTGIGFVTVSNHEEAFKVWTKSGHIIEIVDNKKISLKGSKNVELYASCLTELTSTLASSYTREKNSFYRGYGHGRGGYEAAYRYGGRGGNKKKKGKSRRRYPNRRQNTGPRVTKQAHNYGKTTKKMGQDAIQKEPSFKPQGVDNNNKEIQPSNTPSIGDDVINNQSVSTPTPFNETTDKIETKTTETNIQTSVTTITMTTVAGASLLAIKDLAINDSVSQEYSDLGKQKQSSKKKKQIKEKKFISLDEFNG